METDAGTTQTRRCGQCGAGLAPERAQGLCPACLLKRGLETETGGFAAVVETKATWEPPAVRRLAEEFPELDVLELVGRGGMGAVYKTRQKSLNRVVALKILPPEFGREAAFAQRFAVEAQSLAQLNHPHIVSIYDFGQRGELFFFLMEYVDGLTLRQLLDAGGVSTREALAIVPQICDALQYAHDHGIVHRDIKPENLLLNRDGKVKIADFGLAKIIGTSRREDTQTPRDDGGTARTCAVGTPAYMAPEQREHPGDVDHRADIYALGVVFYQLLTGELPAGRIEPPSAKVVLDVRLDEVVLRALAREPERRYQHASDVKTQVQTIALTPAGGNDPVAARRTAGRAGEASVLLVEMPDGERTVQINANLDICGRPVRVQQGISLLQIVRWIARMAGTFLLLATAILLFAETTSPAGQSSGISWDTAAMVLIMVGVAAGWRYEGLAALLILTGTAALHLASRDVWFKGTMEVPALTGMLYVWCWWLARLTRSRRRWRSQDTGAAGASIDPRKAGVRRRFAWMVLAVVIGMGLVRAFVIAPYYVYGNKGGGGTSQGSYVWVLKLVRMYRTGDVVIYRHQGKSFMGKVVQEDDERDQLLIQQGNKPAISVPRLAMRGRVMGSVTQ